MPLPLAIATYFTIWWIVLFAVLPFGVRSAAEAGVVELPRGVDPGAPMAPMLVKKAIATTLVAAVIFVVLDVLVIYAG
jgi:predicted secreted protein